MASENYNLFSLMQQVCDRGSAIKFLQQKRIIPSKKLCRQRHPMKVQILSDRERWVCNKTTCKSEKPIRKGTWLEGTSLPLHKIVLLIYGWSQQYSTTHFCHREVGISRGAMTDWKNYLREVCASKLLRNPMKIGGPGKVVEIDESCFSRRKYNRGRVYPTQWVFGGVCREDGQCFLYAVPDRTKETLLSVIGACIEPGTTIMSDKWRTYDEIPQMEGMNFTHYTVNHSENFVDPETGAHTQRIESLWRCAKRRNKRESGTHRTMVDSYLCEFMWRRRYKGNDLFEQILEDIAEFDIDA